MNSTEPTPGFPDSYPATRLGNGRYELETLSGSGGIGSVYRAWDHQLGRRVAIKILREDRPQFRERMFREARAQARIDHPHVCGIFDVGEDDERVYIAMQWIEGERLDQIAPRLTLEERILIVRDVADAIQAAHSESIIHRDLKPANILVERRDDGRLHPYVVDFGLARAMDDAGATATGDIVGTPHYLSPEQAWGIAADRRSDVYQLGATLYELLARRPPFIGVTPAEVVMQVVTLAPQPLQRIVKSVPADLAVIAAKCLEKEPERRYDSARALCDELDRWLRGEPILARAPGILRRTAAFLRRHRRVAIAVGIASLITGAVGGARVTALQKERVQREVTARLEERVRYIEKLLEYDRQLPLHDTRPVHARVVSEIALLGRDVTTQERMPLAYAEGRARLAAADFKLARMRLEEAWEGGLRTPAVGFHLSSALISEYGRALADAERISQSELRRARLSELANRYKLAAAAPMAAARNYVEQPAELIDARDAFLNGDDARTIALTSRIVQRFPWNVEARMLEAEARSRGAQQLRLSGKYSESRVRFESARRTYDSALRTAPSDTRLLDALCRVEVSLLQLAADSGGDQEKAFTRAREACDRALIADSESVASLTSLSSAWTRIAYDRGIRLGISEDAAATKNAIELIERALRVAPEDPAVLIQAGSAYYWTELANTPKVTEFMRRAVKADPSSADTHHNLGRALLRLSDWKHHNGQDRRPVLREAAEEYRQVIRLMPDYLPAYQNLCFVFHHSADYALSNGGDPDPYYREMLKTIEPWIARRPDVASLRHMAGVAWYGLASRRADLRQDCSRELALARESFEAAIRLNPRSSNSYLARATVSVLEARLTTDEKIREAKLDAADADLALDQKTYKGRSDILLLRAAHADRDLALQYLRRASEYMDQMARDIPDAIATSFLQRGKIEMMRCRVAPRQCNASLAEEHFEKAVALNPNLRGEVKRARAE